MKARLIAFLVITILFYSCSASKTKATPEQLQALNELIESKSFVIESEWAMPLVTSSLTAIQNSGLIAPNNNNINRINLLSNPNELRLEEGYITSQLPYYGEVQIPSAYNAMKTGIALDSEIKNYKVQENKNGSYTVTFDAKSDTEHFDVTIQLWPSLKTEMTLNGAKRLAIRYEGKARMLEGN
ncbi:DUF4251 domain-containing protein [Winogradskyella sp. 3972H.M.0a.05]|uniref:DUF4251 domain-containing protein n=1 Tax=Winogradskyella sp. 3972H.M.0a.05 TaxID=2950277 RepID=UPI0033934B88